MCALKVIDGGREQKEIELLTKLKQKNINEAELKELTDRLKRVRPKLKQVKKTN